MATTPESTQSGSNGQAGTPAAAAGSAQTAAPAAPKATAPAAAPGVGATQAGANGATSVQPTAKVEGAEVNRGTAASDAVSSAKAGDSDGKMKAVEAGRQEEQAVGKELDKANADSDYFQQVANDDAVFNDPTRQEHRQMRAQEQEAKLGDPTRDPVAKQEAMDMNTPREGAVEEAAKINKGEDPAKRSK